MGYNGKYILRGIVLRNNIFTLFLNKVFAVPFWVKQVMFLRLQQEMRDYACEDFLRNHSTNDIFATYVPTITFKGKTELIERKCGLDNNIYNFLSCCEENFSVLEISVNTFLSMEEVAKYYEFCLEQNFVKNPNSTEILSMAGFISGKFRTGEYFKQKGMITVDQLGEAINVYEKNPDKKFGEVLVALSFIKEGDLKAPLKLKEEAKKRFILDHSTMPKSETAFANDNQKYESEITTLKEENQKLKQKLLQLLDIVKKNG